MTQPIALVTGGSGFVGPYLIAALEAAGREVVATGQAPARRPGQLYPPETHARWRELDLRDRVAVAALVGELRPQEVYHLAALSSVAESFADPAPTYETNVMGTLYLLDALRRLAPAARVVLVSSAEVYGGPSAPLAEETPFAPANPYAASKVAAEMVALEHFRAHGLAVMRARAFSHTGPGQGDRFVVSSFAKQIAQIESARQAPVIAVGNLEARRDFLDVRDVVRAYVAIAEAGEPGRAYNVCSGRAVSMRALLDGLVARASVRVEITIDPAKLRPLDVAELVGSHQALSAATGWRPEIALDRTLDEILAYWRAELPFRGDAVTSLA